jgi:hypothetical protein
MASTTFSKPIDDDIKSLKDDKANVYQAVNFNSITKAVPANKTGFIIVAKSMADQTAGVYVFVTNDSSVFILTEIKTPSGITMSHSGLNITASASGSYLFMKLIY